MRRRVIHTGFAILSAVCLTAAGMQFMQLSKAKSTARAIAEIDITKEKPKNTWAQLAWANGLADAGEFENAEKAYNELIRQHKTGPLGQAARFNLGNSYYRRGTDPNIDPATSRAMLELAKQRYRDLIKATPDDWKARYNLERALRSAPEFYKSDDVNDKGKPVKSVNVVVPDFQIRDLP